MQPLIPVEAIAFDCFDTLVKITSPSYVYRDLVERLPKHYQPPAKKALMMHPWSLEQTVVQLGVACTEGDLSSLSERLASELASIVCFDDTREVLLALRARGYRLALCSNLALPYSAPVEGLIGKLLDVKIWSYEVGAIKPDPKIYDTLCSSLDLSPERVLMIGDSQTSDFAGARAAGLNARHLTRGVPDHRLALHRLASLEDVLRLVK